MKFSFPELIIKPRRRDSCSDVVRICGALLGCLCLGAAPPLTFVPPPDGQPIGRDVPVGILAGADAARVILSYRPTGTVDYTEATMLTVGDEFWATDIPAAAVTAQGVEFFITAEDANSPPARITSPPEGAAAPWMFTTDDDDEAGPQVIHVPIAAPQPEDQAVEIVAFAADASFVSELRVHYRAPGDGFASAILFKRGGGLFRGEIPAVAVVPPVVEYYLEAEDARLVPNRTASPPMGAAGPLSFPIDQPGAPTLTHTPVSSPHNVRTAIAIAAEATDDVAVTQAWVFYGTGSSNFSEAVALSGQGATFTGEIPAADVVLPELHYYLEVADADGHVVRDPSDAPRAAHRITIVDPDPGDVEPPQITHVAPDGPQMWRQPVAIAAQASDASTIFAVRLNVALASSSTTTMISTIFMTRAGDDRFEAEIPSNLVRGANVRYFFVAIDASSHANEARSPADAPASWHSFVVVGDPNVADPNEPIEALYTGNGCGCSTGGSRHRGGFWALLAGGVAVFLRSWRRR